MFSNTIAGTAMTTSPASSFFKNIIGGEIYGDNTFLSTLRALLGKRIGENTLVLSASNLSMIGDFMTMSEKDIVSKMERRMRVGANGMLIAFVDSNNKEADKRVMEAIGNHYAEMHKDEGWVRLPVLTDFFRKTCDVQCFINAGTKSTIIVLRGMDMRLIHYIQVGILTAVPWYFNPSKGDKVSELEMNLINSLRERTPDNYLKYLREIAAEYDFENSFIRDCLFNIEKSYEVGRLDALKNEVDMINQRILGLHEDINALMRNITVKNTELMALQFKLNQDDESHELYEYFICNKTLRLEGVRHNTCLDYHVNTYIEYFDEMMAESVISNKRSFLYSFAPNKTAAERIAKAIFVDRSIRIRTSAAYYLDVSGGFDAMSHHDYGEDFLDHMPNPHIDHHACIGDHYSVMREHAQNRDYISFIEQTVSSAKSLNFGDGIVMEEFFRDMFDGVGGRCYELEDGRLMNINELMNYVMEENNE